MRLWMDGQCLQSVSRRRGIGRYVGEFIAALAQHRPDLELSISFNAALPDETVAARDFVGQWIPAERIHVWQGAAEVGEGTFGNTDRRQLSELALRHHVACIDPDLALSTSSFEGMLDRCIPYLPGPTSACRTAALFFDAIPYRFPDRYLTSPIVRAAYDRRLAALERFDLLLAISQFSMREALEIHPSSRVVNIDAAVSADFIAALERPLDPLFTLALGIRKPYVLYVGGLDWRKNVGAVAEAFARLPDERAADLQLVVVGDYPAASEGGIVSQWHLLRMPTQNLRLLGHVTDGALVQLYKQAHVVIQPSVMEGFGLTALEAMTCGTPVLAAGAGALPEVICNTDALFDPFDPGDIAAHIMRSLTDASFLADLTRSSSERAAFYSWARTAGLAADALLALTREDARAQRPVDREALREAAYALVAPLDVPTEEAQLLMAASEPQASGGRRLLVEVTSTARVDHATGIQRVVNRITQALVARCCSDEAVVVAYCDSKAGMYEACLDRGRVSFGGHAPASHLRFRATDTLLMLDSSWEFYEAQRHVLRKARIQGCDVIATLFDLVPVTLPGFCDAGMPPVFARWLEVALLHSTAFVCISRAVADEFLELLIALRFPRALRIGYWHLGADFHLAPRPGAPSGTTASSTPSFLMVGTLEPRKGHRIAVDAFDRLWKAGFEGQLVIAGRPGWGVDPLLDAIRGHAEFGGRLRLVVAPTDAELEGLYQDCDALIAASYGEGFGLPLVEAAHYGKPVIASDLAAFREVSDVSRGALYFDVGSVDALMSAITRFRDEQATHAAAARAAPPWLTWDESAAQLDALIRSETWYHHYAPVASSTTREGSGLESLTMVEAFDIADRAVRIDLVEGPTPETQVPGQALLVKVTNLSRRLWSSVGVVDGRFGIAVGCRLRGADGRIVMDEHVRSRIPFALLPSHSLILKVALGDHYWSHHDCRIEVEMVQEGVAWWGHALTLSAGPTFASVHHD